jgi:hypothetical protein
MSCRISGFIPKAAPGRKPSRVNLKLSWAMLIISKNEWLLHCT